MSEFKICLTTIKNIQPHPNAERLDIATVFGFNVVVRKGSYNVDDATILVPIDSVLPKYLEDFIFPEGSKVKLSNSRVKQIRIRQFPSQGLLMSPFEVNKCLMLNDKDAIDFKFDVNYMEALEIKKFEPPEITVRGTRSNLKPIKKVDNNPYLINYNGIDNFKWYPDLFEEGEEVYITEKLHGTSCKFGYLPKDKFTTWEKIKKFFGFSVSDYEWCYASNNVQLQNKKEYKGFYGDDIYAKAIKEANGDKNIWDGIVCYGEIIGEGIQKFYDYGLKGKHKLVLFDIMTVSKDGTHRYLNPDEFIDFCDNRGFERVPELYRGPFNKELAKSLTLGDSVYCPTQKVREGVVIKPIVEKTCVIGRKKLKLISEAYLDRNSTDYH
jgi:RNA ligase (TIGR02306 family)